MEKEEIKKLLSTIEQEVSSSILGGMEESYEELEQMGYVIIHPDSARPSATLTQKGADYLESN